MVKTRYDGSRAVRLKQFLENPHMNKNEYLKKFKAQM